MTIDNGSCWLIAGDSHWPIFREGPGGCSWIIFVRHLAVDHTAISPVSQMNARLNICRNSHRWCLPPDQWPLQQPFSARETIEKWWIQPASCFSLRVLPRQMRFTGRSARGSIHLPRLTVTTMVSHWRWWKLDLPVNVNVCEGVCEGNSETNHEPHSWV